MSWVKHMHSASGWMAVTIFCLISAATINAGDKINDALKSLKSGNVRYSTGSAEYPRLDQARRNDTFRNGQHPFATVIACSDSRVLVEAIFDQGIGDVFVIKVAGNVSDTDEIGSIEYGVDHLGTPVMVVLGHTSCGAVTAVVTEAELHGSIPLLVDNIIPAVEKARRNYPNLSGKDLVPEAVKMNVWQSIDDLFKNSPVTRKRVSSGVLTVVGAVYDISTGGVEWMGQHPEQGRLLSYSGGGHHGAGHSASHSSSHESGGNGGHGGSIKSQKAEIAEAEKLLFEGNKRYMRGSSTFLNLDQYRRTETSTYGQHPFATVIACSDSRVPVERVFDRGIGDVFTIRVAGNVADIDEIGSIEYGVDHLETPLFVALGHTNCGAVTAVVTNAEVHGSIPPLVDNIIPAVRKAERNNPHLHGKELVPAAVRMNVWQTIEDLLKNSPSTAARVKAGAVKVVGAIYHIEDGSVEWLGTHPDQGTLLYGPGVAIASTGHARSGGSHGESASKAKSSHGESTTKRSQSASGRQSNVTKVSHRSDKPAVVSHKKEAGGSGLFWTLGVLTVAGLAAGLYFKNKKGAILMSWTIGKKLGAAFAALVVLLLTISAISYFGLTKIDQDVELLVRAQKESQEIESVELLIAEQLYAEKEFLLTGEEHLLEKHEEWGNEGREVLKSLEREFREKGDEVGLAEIMEIEREYEEYEHTFEEVVELYLAGEVDEAIKLSDEVSDAEASVFSLAMKSTESTS